MADILIWVGYFSLILIYPLLLGPVAVYVYLWVLRQGNKKNLTVFWAGLLIAHGLGFILLVMTLDTGFPGSGFFSCLITPIFSVLSILILRRKGLTIQIQQDRWRKRWLQFGMFVIPVLQIIVVFLLVLFGPALCETPLRSCSPF